LVKEPEKLKELPGIGDRMVEHLEEIVKTGDYTLRKKLLKKYPATILDLLQLQSLGRRRLRSSGRTSKPARWPTWNDSPKRANCATCPDSGKERAEHSQAVEVFKKSRAFSSGQSRAAALAIAAHIKAAGKLWNP